jgi:hypothetical protein
MYYESPKLNYDYFIVCIDYICNGVSNGDNQIRKLRRLKWLWNFQKILCFLMKNTNEKQGAGRKVT